MPDVSGGLSEQTMEKAMEAAQTAVFTAIGGSRQPDASTAWAIAEKCLEAALSVLIESGELVAGVPGPSGRRGFNAQAEGRPGVTVGEDLADKIAVLDAKLYASERRGARAERALAECKELLERLRAIPDPAVNEVVRACLARLGSEAGE